MLQTCWCYVGTLVPFVASAILLIMNIADVCEHAFYFFVLMTCVCSGVCGSGVGCLLFPRIACLADVFAVLLAMVWCLFVFGVFCRPVDFRGYTVTFLLCVIYFVMSIAGLCDRSFLC